jgi:phenylacetate-CoA ligase
MQERFAMLDDFRSRLGYKLGKKTALFSGKSLFIQRDVQKNRFCKKRLLATYNKAL